MLGLGLALLPCLLFGQSNFVHDLCDSLTRARHIPLLNYGLAQGQPQLRQFDRAAQIIGNTHAVQGWG